MQGHPVTSAEVLGTEKSVKKSEFGLGRIHSSVWFYLESLAGGGEENHLSPFSGVLIHPHSPLPFARSSGTGAS